MASPSFKPTELIISCEISSDGGSLDVEFHDQTFTFHAQWLNDAKCDDGPSRSASTAFCQRAAGSRIEGTHIVRKGPKSTLNVAWNDATNSEFPAVWLRVMAPLVAKPHSPSATEIPSMPKGWLARTLSIPSLDYSEVFADNSEQSEATAVRILDELLQESATGIVQITGLPAPSVESERDKTNTLVTQVLKKIFGTVFVHPRRGTDKTFNVASHHQEDTKRAAGLPNYDTNQVLLPHVDHAHYQHPIQVQGWYGLEGESENTFVSGIAALRTLKQEAPDLFEPLTRAPMAVGRVVHYYDPPLFQGAVDTPVTMHPGTTRVKRLRWHPHLSGSLVTSFDDFHTSRRAHQKMQEIMRRDTHQLKVHLKPGDLYVWNNFTILHGRERVLKVPRTGVGQTVPEQVVADTYRALKMGQLQGHIEEKWLVHVPTPQLHDLVQLIHV